MLHEFLAFIQKEKLFEKNDKVLLMVSGGVDSIVMCNLFYKAGFSFGIAHCNFNLRGKESDEDQKHVQAIAEQYKVDIWHKTFNTKAYSNENNVSIQMAARTLRYEWLQKIAAENKYSYIASAHHLDDSIETFFINLLRGTGITGLQGISVKQGKIIRPLLFANKKMIRDYAKAEKLIWQEDSSNETDKYLRNNIRHHLIPSLKKLNKGFEKTITKELGYFKDAAEILKKFIEEKKKEIVVQQGKNILFNIKQLKNSGYAATILHELLSAYGFTPETTGLIAKHLYATAGKKFLSPTYRLIKDREFFILTPLLRKKKEQVLLIKQKQTEFKDDNLNLKIEVISGSIEQIKDKSGTVGYFDYNSLTFPLKIRRWKQGDYFYPLGMTGKKKLSDFFIDKKLSLDKKENVFVLESDGDIVWVLHHRIDERFKVQLKTKSILRISILS